jgi:hypothetical protein
MKKLLSLLSLLCLTLSGFAQETEYFIIRKKNSTTDLYKVTATRDVSIYASTDQGYEDFRQAVSNGLVVRYTEDGCPIAIGVRAPLTKPTCATVILVAYNQTFSAETAAGGGAIYDKGGAEGGKIKDGELTYSVPNIPAPGSYTLALTYQSNSTVPTAQVSVNGGSPTPIQLAATGGVLNSATATIPGFTAGTNSVKITPNGYFASDKITISRAGSTTVTDPGSGTSTPPGSTTGLLSFNRGYFGGNSFNKVGVIPNTQWTAERGMAASDLAHDYCHVLEAALKTKNPNFSAYVTANLSPFETEYVTQSYDYNARITGDLNFNFNNAPPQFDLIVLSISENINEATFDKPKFFAGLDQLITTIPKSTTYTVVLRNSLWGGHTTSSAALQEYATLHNYKFANFSDRVDYPAYQATNFSDPGFAKHWNDAGHAEIATRFAAQLTGTTTTPPVDPPTTAMRGGYAEGTLDQLYAFAPFVPDQNQKDSWTNQTEKTQTNSRIRFAIHKSIGASITRIEDVRQSENMVNTWNRDQPSVPDLWDKGRSGDVWGYGTHKKIQIGNQRTDDTDDDTGYNGIPAGDRYAHQNPVDYYQRKTVTGYGDVDYTRTVTMMWSMNQVRTEYVRHAWYWLEGEAIRYFYIYENNRTDTQMWNQGMQQEFPGIYTSANYYHHKVELGSNGDVTEVTSPPPGSPPNNQTDTGPKNTTQNYMGSYRDDGYGITIFSPYTSRFNGKQFNSRLGNYQELASSYINCAPFTDLDSPRKVALSGYIHVGTNAEFKAWKAAHAPIELLPFATSFAGGRFNGWSSVDAKTKPENGRVVFYITDVNPTSITQDNPSGTRGEGKFNSQYGNWPASSLSTIYLNVESIGVTQLEVGWIKAGQSDNDAASQRKVINITNPNSAQTLTINMAGTPGWDGTIARFFIGTPVSLRPSMTGNERFVPNWINTVNSAPAN